MKPQTKKALLYGVGVLAISGIATYVVLEQQRKKLQIEYNELLTYAKSNANLTGTAADLAIKGNAFDPTAWRSNTSCPKLPLAKVREYAKTIYDAKGLVYDQETNVVGVFRQINNKCDVSRLADVFQQMYKRDLYTYLKSFMVNFGGTDYLAQVNDIVNEMN